MTIINPAVHDGDRPITSNHPGTEVAAAPVMVATAMTPLRASKITAAVLGTVALAWIGWQVRSVVVLVVLGILFAAAIEPASTRLRRAGLSRGQAILAVYALLFALLVAGIALVAPPLVVQAQQFVSGIPVYLDGLRQQISGIANPGIRGVGLRGVARAEQLYTEIGKDPSILTGQLGQAAAVLGTFLGTVFTTLTVLIVAFYWLTEKTLIKRLLLHVMPPDQRERTHSLWDDIEEKLGGWARGQLLLMAIIGAASTIFYGAIGLPFWFLLGLWAGITEAIPFVGPYLGGGLAVLVALTESWQRALVVAIFVVVLQQVEGNVVVPRVMRSAVGLTPLTVILALMAGATLAGPLGAVLAIPIAAAIQVVLAELVSQRDEEREDEQVLVIAAMPAEAATVTEPVKPDGIARPAPVD
jgi:predicted PurR-regulated permease PerM